MYGHIYINEPGGIEEVLLAPENVSDGRPLEAFHIYCRLSPDQMINLLGWLRNGASTNELHLSRDFMLGAENWSYVGEVLSGGRALKKFVLHLVNAGLAGTRHIASALRLSLILQELYLDHVQVGSEGAIYIADALRENTSLRALKLSRTNLGDEGAQRLVEALEVNRTL